MFGFGNSADLQDNANIRRRNVGCVALGSVGSSIKKHSLSGLHLSTGAQEAV